MAHWQHASQRGGHIGLGLRSNAVVRSDGIFEAPDDHDLESRLLAAGHERLARAPAPEKATTPKVVLTAHQAKLAKRVARRAAEAKAEAAKAKAEADAASKAEDARQAAIAAAAAKAATKAKPAEKAPEK